jgi:small subunit ribosomal protein S16
MLVIRLQRVGKKNQPSYRVVLAEKTFPVKGKFIEILGNYNPRQKTKAFEKDRILHWLSKGAQASPTVHNLLVSEKIVDAPKVKAWAPKKKEGEEKPAAAVPAAVKKEIPAESKAKEEAKPEKKKEEKPEEVKKEE